MNMVDIKGKGTKELSGGVLRLRWKQGTYIGIDVARATLETISVLGQGAKLPMLVEVQAVTHSAAARKVIPAPVNISRMALLGSSPVDRVIAMFRLSLVQAGYPIRYFTSQAKAMEWLLHPAWEEGMKLGYCP